MADVLILNYVDYETTQKLLDKIKKYESIEHICIVDNASPNDSFERLKNNCSERIFVIKTPRNGGYGYGNNYGIRFLYENYKSKYILLCNPDVIFENEIVGQLESFLENNSSYVIAAPFMLDRNKLKQKNTAFKIGSLFNYIMSYGMIYSKIFKPGEYSSITENNSSVMDVEAVAGSLFMLDAKKMIGNTLFDENVFLYCEERILGMKCKNANLKIALLPQCSFIHNHSVSISKTIGTEVKKRRVMNKSAIYVIKEYYKANALEILFAKIMMSISIGEMKFWEIVREKRRG